MKQPSLQAISPETYQQLRAWASLEPDFVHLGSHGTGPGRGRWQAFSARATGHYPSTREDSPATAARDVAQAMEALVANYRLAPASPGPNVPMGGLVGFLGYEYGYLKEPRLAPLCPDLPVATLHAGLFLEHLSQRLLDQPRPLGALHRRHELAVLRLARRPQGPRRRRGQGPGLRQGGEQRWSFHQQEPLLTVPQPLLMRRC